MSKIDKLKEEKSDYKEIFRALIYLILAILTGVTTVAYKILVKDVASYMVVVSGIGLIVAFLVSLYTLKVWHKMQRLNKEIGDA